jgi:hypothetical protein
MKYDSIVQIPKADIIPASVIPKTVFQFGVWCE